MPFQVFFVVVFTIFYHNAHMVVTKMVTEETLCLPCQTRPDYLVDLLDTLKSFQLSRK